MAEPLPQPDPVPLRLADSELLMLFCRGGDDGAFRQLVERYAPLVMGVCRQVLRHRQDAEDVFQATFLILARRAGRLQTQSSLAGWLHRVAFHAAVRASKQRLHVPADPLPPLASTLPDAFQQVQLREMQQILHEELLNLKSLYREVIILCDLQGNSREEAAERLECTEASVKAALARGRKQLRRQLIRRGVVFSVALAVASELTLNSLPAGELAVSTAQLGTAWQAAGSAKLSCSQLTLNLVREGVSVMKWNLLTKTVAAFSLAGVSLVGTLLAMAGEVEPLPEPSPLVQTRAPLDLTVQPVRLDLTADLLAQTQPAPLPEEPAIQRADPLPGEPFAPPVAPGTQPSAPPSPYAPTGLTPPRAANPGDPFAPPTAPQVPSSYRPPTPQDDDPFGPPSPSNSPYALPTPVTQTPVPSYAPYAIGLPQSVVSPYALEGVEETELHIKELSTRVSGLGLKIQGLELKVKTLQAKAGRIKQLRDKGIVSAAEDPLEYESEALLTQSEIEITKADRLALERQGLALRRHLQSLQGVQPLLPKPIPANPPAPTVPDLVPPRIPSPAVDPLAPDTPPTTPRVPMPRVPRRMP